MAEPTNYFPAVQSEGGMNATELKSSNPTTASGRRLLLRDEVLTLLCLGSDILDRLVNTRQLTPLRIAGQERFDSQDLDRLIGEIALPLP